MRVLFASILAATVRCLVALRYRVRLHAPPRPTEISRPVLLLPNHPALIDPVLVFAITYPRFRPRMIIYEGNFSPLIRFLLKKLLQVVLIPDLRHPSREAHERAEKAIAEVIAGMKQGDNFILWPSGHVQRDGVERLGSARALTDLLDAVPQASLVAIRTCGVWGSMFSFAQKGRVPILMRCLVQGAALLLANLLFLAPRRHVEMTIERIDRTRLPELNRDAVNRWFEAWYNANGPETPTFVPYHFLFGTKHFDFPSAPQVADAELDFDELPRKTRDEVMAILADHLRRPIKPEELDAKVKLDDLGLDSLQRMDVAIAVEERFGSSAETSPETVGQLLAMASGASAAPSAKVPDSWFSPPGNPAPLRIMGETIPTAFVERALATPKDIAAADDLSGVVTYERLLIGALLMSHRFARVPGKHIGLMLPASVASDVMLLGLYFAGKLPVLLNWTTGPANLLHAVKLTEITHVITSKRMRDRLGLDIEGVQFLDVEDLRKETGFLDRVGTFMTVRCFPNRIRRHVQSVQPSDLAVILFTSGSEKAPKGVPLTHGNIVSNLRAVPAILDLTNKDAVLGFLPMFHSFGFTMTGLFPLLGGIRVVHHPDPTDTSGLRRKIAAYGTTVIVGMPTMINSIFGHSKPDDLKSLKLIAVGAERCPPKLFETVHRVTPDAILLEGYGVTECSPAVSANRPSANRPGTIGQALPGFDVCVVDLTSRKVVPAGTMGMLLVSGPSVFHGYMGDEPSPFVEVDGKQWYVTGDLVSLDADGFIEFRGRLKRFIKAGGEMISLPALEEPFAQKFPPDDDGPRVAVEGIETDNGRKIVLFTKVPMDVNEANALLSQEGFRGVMRLDEVRHVNPLPVLGGGKIDYRRLREMIAHSSPSTTT